MSQAASSHRSAFWVVVSFCLLAHACAGAARPDDDALIQRLDDARWQIRASAADELGRRKAASAAFRLGQALLDASEEVRGSAVMALDRIGAHSELDNIRKLIDDEEDPQVTVLALFALADLAEGEGGPALQQDAERVIDRVFDDNRRVKRAARRVMQKLLGDDAQARLAELDAAEGGGSHPAPPIGWRYDRIEDRLSLAQDGTCTLTRTATIRGESAEPIDHLELLLPEPFREVDSVTNAGGAPLTFTLDWAGNDRLLQLDAGSVGLDETATFTWTARSLRSLFLGGGEAMVVYRPGRVDAPVGALHIEISVPGGAARPIEPDDLTSRARADGGTTILDRRELSRDAVADVVVRLGVPSSAVTPQRPPPRYTSPGWDLTLAAGVAAWVAALLAATILWLRRRLGEASPRAILVAVLAAGGILLISPSLIEDNLPYYALARSAVLDGDLDRVNEYTEFNQTQAYAPDRRGALDPVFASLFSAPSIAAAHGLCAIVNAVAPSYAPNGFSFPYLYLSAIGDFLAVLFGCLACFSLVERRVGRPYALFAVLSVVLGTNLLLFTYGWTGSSFQPSFLVFAVFLDYWDRTRESRTSTGWLGAGVLLGILGMTRTLNAGFVLIPFLDWLHAAGSRLKREGAPGLVEPLRDGAMLSAGMLLGYAPQLVAQRLVDRTWFVDAYGVGTGRFNGLMDHLYGLFISRRDATSYDGLLLAMPLLVLAFIGLVPLIRLDRRLGVLVTAALGLQLLAIGSYEVYWGYFRYGTPYLVPSSPIFCLAMGSLMKAVRSRWSLRGQVALWGLTVPLFARNGWCLIRQVGSDTMGAWNAKLGSAEIVHSTLLLDRKVDFDRLRGSGDVASLLRETVGALRTWTPGPLLPVACWTALLLAGAWLAFVIWSRWGAWMSRFAAPNRRRAAILAFAVMWIGLMGWVAKLGAGTNVDYRILSTRETVGRRLLKIERIEPGETFTLPLAVRNPADGVSMITFLDGGTRAPQGKPVATVEFDPSWTRTHFELRAGVDTADYAVDRPESRTERAHRAPLDRACFTWRVRDDSSQFYSGRAYSSYFDVRNPGTSGEMKITSTLDRGTLVVVWVSVLESKLPNDLGRRRWLADRW